MATTKKRPANPAPGTLEERRRAYAELASFHTHDALDGETAKRIAAPFGLHHEGYEMTANTRDPKGLFIDGLPRNAKVRRVGMFDLVEDICRHLGLKYEGKMGRGFQARVCLEALANALDEEEAAGRWLVEWGTAGDDVRHEVVEAPTAAAARASVMGRGHADCTVHDVSPAAKAVAP